MRHLLRRLGFYLIAFWAAITINFILPRLAPGDPASAFIARFQGRVDPKAIDALRIQFGVTNDPMWIQYFQYLNNLLHGNLGLSVTYFPAPVIQVIGQELPWTLGLVLISLIISVIIGTVLGALVAWRRNGFLDNLLPPIFTFVSSVPYFCLALLLLYVLGFTLGWFPTSGGYDRNMIPDWSSDFMYSVFEHALLPALSFVLASMAGWMLGMRSAMITTLAEDYVLMAEAKGLPERRVLTRYAARNAILPNLTGFAIALGSAVAGQLLIEIVFSYPGIGFSLLQAVQGSDYALMQGMFLLIVAAVLGANFLVDLLYTVLDPRVRQGKG
ncbi:MAG: ABC transporter permease [Ktedonobacteraceae bacterium]|nr:ABC transporter permease [Ktedonobacteraceae bacterium]MBO0793378.1 ABC transporter permease [Ktedonobacteraceae bacterium]